MEGKVTAAFEWEFVTNATLLNTCTVKPWYTVPGDKNKTLFGIDWLINFPVQSHFNVLNIIPMQYYLGTLM